MNLSSARAYEALVAYGVPSLREQVAQGYARGHSIPGSGIAQNSQLWRLLKNGHHEVMLDEEDRERFLTWLDNYAQRLGSFGEEQERELMRLRATAGSWLVDRSQ